MANEIGWEKKLEKQNRQQQGINKKPSNETSSTSYSHDKFNKNIDVVSKK